MTLTEIPHFLLICLEVLIIFNLIIVVHEMGHFWAARWRGLVVEKFGIWFGKPLWKKTINGVEYSLGCIPFGGFVALPQMAPMDKIEGRAEGALAVSELPEVKPLDKIIVAFAGPLFSFLFAVICATVVWGIGRPVSEGEATTTIGYVFKESPAEKAGLLAGDKILEVDNEPVTRFGGMSSSSVMWRVVRSENDIVPIKIERAGEVLTKQVQAERAPKGMLERASLKQILIAPAQTPMVGAVMPNSPALVAGLKPNDLILAADGQRLLSSFALSDYLSTRPGQPVTLLVKRGDQEFSTLITPEIPIKPEGSKEHRLGLVWDLSGEMKLVHPLPWEQIHTSVNTMLNTLGAVISPKSDIKPQHLSGPVGIMRFYYLLFESEQGWRMAIWFSVLFNINLAILNLLPIPVLDGGHITLAIIEWIRRRPISVRVLEYLQSACVVVVMGFLVYVTFFDVQDLPWKQTPRQAGFEFSPKSLSEPTGP
jgi:regulator of sigma E protease